MPRFPVPVPVPTPDIQHPEADVAVWHTHPTGFEAGTVGDYVQNRRRQAADHPHDRNARRELGRAYLWSGDAESAIEILAPLHVALPGDREVQSLILDALSLLGHSPADYPWIEPPTLVPLDHELLDRLHELLARERRPATVLDLCLTASEAGHPTFDADGLLRKLEADGRFLVYRSSLAPECAVVLAQRHPRDD